MITFNQNVNMNQKKLSGLANPTESSDAVNLGYLQSTTANIKNIGIYDTGSSKTVTFTKNPNTTKIIGLVFSLLDDNTRYWLPGYIWWTTEEKSREGASYHWSSLSQIQNYQDNAEITVNGNEVTLESDKQCVILIFEF